MIAKDYKPVWTCWSEREIRTAVIRHKRYVRHAYKRYLKGGDIKDLDRSRRLLTRWDFD
jgi:hypothetical protein